MSHTMPLLEPVLVLVLVLVLVDDASDVDLSGAGSLEVELAVVEVSDSAGTVVTAGCVTPPKLDAPPPPPQAGRTHASARRWTKRMQVSLADSLAEVSRQFMAVTVG